MLDFSSLEKALSSFENALKVAEDILSSEDENLKETVRAGVIQNFEFTYEICWKFMRRWLMANLGANTVEGVSRKELFRLSAENKLINNVNNWMEYHDARNETSHAYDKDTAEGVFETAKGFLSDAKSFSIELKKKND